MKLWCADTYDFGVYYSAGCPNVLLSYAEARRPGPAQRWLLDRPADADVFLDSGAYGVFTGRAQVDVKEYCAYLHTHREKVTCYASLDVIGDWRTSASNYDIMRRDGLQPIPTFHMGSPWEAFDVVAGSGAPVIGLGGMAARGTTKSLETLGPFLDGAWSRLEKYWPIKVHAFGIILQDILERYPFYSSDSTSAVLNSAMGKVMQFTAGRSGLVTRHDYARNTYDISVMDGAPPEFLDGGIPPRSARIKRSVQALVQYEQFITGLWAARGVTWQ
jgi:hypothetical protein